MSWLVANTFVAGVMALLVLLIGRFRPAPAVMHGLWLLVLLKLATPPLVQVPIDVGMALPATHTPAPTSPVPQHLHDPAVLAMDHAAPAAPWLPSAAPVDVTPLAPPSALVAPAIVVPAWSWQQVLFAVWLAGASVMFVWLGVGLVRSLRRLRTLGPVPQALSREVADLARELGVAKPRLCDDPAAGSPYVWSFGRTRLVLPARALAATSPKGRAAVLAHELAHLRRRDHWWAHVEMLLMVLLWWHPLFWFARARLRAFAELACDAWAVASVPDASLDYATVLVQAVATPDSAVPGPAVLAARPAARAAFERRLTMILNENVPCRASRAWWLPFTSLALGLFAVPTVAQSRPQDPKPVEIRVNGKDVEDLSAAERKALLKKLLAAEESADTPKAAGKKGAKAGAKPQTLVITEAHEHEGHDHEAHEQEAHEVHRAHGHQVPGGMPSTKEIHAQIKAGLAEARAEIEGDEDLRELGITDEVCQLIDDLADGKGLGNLDALVKKAMQGAGKLAVKEIAADEDLKKLGMTEGITKLVQGFLGDERMQEMVCDLAQSAAKNALKEAKVELRNDPDLKKLGITVDVEGLLDGMFTGHGDFGTHLQQIIEKAMQHAKHEGLIEIGGEPMEVDVVEVPAPKKAGKKGRKAKSDR